ncbi:MAG: DUF2007 domain-containing protein [Armatimonadota bacterium]|nr:DUF2007 domain-containing protein [Armatimonadota bacterium]
MNHEGYVSVFQAPDELTANLIKGILEAEDIDVIIHSHQVPWMDSIMKPAEGFWGDILVPEEEAERAKKVLEAYESGSKILEEEE